MTGRTFMAIAIALGLASTSSTSWSQSAQPGAGRGGQATAPAAPMVPSSIVRVRDGQVRGKVAQGVESYLGIPFAAPPVANLRWRAPQAPAGWRAVRDASAAGGSCGEVEDCLYLNVQRPVGAKAGDRLPVMVWIHGGSFTGGAGANYDGTEFVKKGIVVVTVNYRLGRAGWFAHPALSREGPTGNYGLMDQVASLKWVRDNVASFGGDPKQVTIFGESAGGISVLYLVLSPEARGLFSKAIAESAFARHSPRTLQQQEAAGIELAGRAGVTGTGPEAAAALRRLPITAIPRSGGYADLNRPHPIVDGRFIEQPLADGFAAGKQAKIPLMIGGNSNEASLYRPDGTQLPALAARRDAMLSLFDPSRSGNAQRIVNDLVTVERITEPDRNLSRIHSRAGQPTYLYYFSYLPRAQRASSLGAAHGAEIRYVFGNLGQDATPEDLATHQAMNAYWASFAKYGDPGAAGGVAWPKYDAAREPSLEFASDGLRVHDKFQAAKLDFVEQGLRSPSNCPVTAFPLTRC